MKTPKPGPLLTSDGHLSLYALHTGHVERYDSGEYIVTLKLDKDNACPVYRVILQSLYVGSLSNDTFVVLGKARTCFDKHKRSVKKGYIDNKIDEY